MLHSRQGVLGVRLITIALGGLIAYGLVDRLSEADEPPAKRKKARVEVLFSPDGGCTDRVIREIEQAEKTIRVQMYIFTSQEIAEAIVAAQKRGVECTVIVDKSQKKMKYSRLPILRRGGVTVLVDAEHRTANNKIMLIDEDTILTGSFNYTKAAEEHNAENLLIIKWHRKTMARYLRNFEKHLEHSREM